jgi:hypothetical protein
VVARNAHRPIQPADIGRSTRQPPAVVLPIAVRVFTRLKDTKKRRSNERRTSSRPSTRFVFDCETTTDETQRLTFGSYRIIKDNELLEEGLFYAPDLSSKGRRTLQRYVNARNPRPGRIALRFHTLSEFRDLLHKAMYKWRALVVGFNLPFDFSRLADSVTDGRGQFVGGFSLSLDSFRGGGGRLQHNRFRPRLRIKHIDSKRALMGLAGRMNPDTEDLIPDDSEDGKPKKGYRVPGHILDLRTLAFGLTNQAYSLKSACEAFGVEHGKQALSRHGIVTAKYIDYNRRDVQATTELADKLLAELDRHPVELPATRAYSPASLGKAYLAQMGIRPILERQPRFPTKYLGRAQTAFFGGRTSAHIRRVPVPVVYTDFLSMYPTVNALMDLWPVLTARHVRVVDRCARQVRAFLKGITPERLFIPSTWRKMKAFVQIVPDNDLLPCRAVYSDVSKDWQVGINSVSAGTDGTEHALWFALPDVVASVLRTAKIPGILDAFRVVGIGRLRTLQPVQFRGLIPVDPKRDDFFRAVVEQRERLKTVRTDETERTRAGLKVLANSTAYGINAEFVREDRQRPTAVVCHGLDPEGFEDRVEHPERPGRYCFPPLAALITAGARLMLSLLEHEIERRGGTYAMEDTDSMAIVATEPGGLVRCPGGPHRLSDGSEAVRALTWRDVREIAQRFERLNPYDRRVVPGSILKIEDDNFDATGEQRQVYCFAISAKRYALFELDPDGEPRLLRDGENSKNDRWSEHGLGHLLNPSNPDDDDRDWIGQVWNSIVRRSLGFSGSRPSFAGLPAVGRVTVSSPTVLRPFRFLNDRRSYPSQVKPFNFLLTCHVAPFGHPPGVEPTQFHLVAPYDLHPDRWQRTRWIDQYSGKTYRVQCGDFNAGSRGVVHVQTYGDVLEAYEFHPESKCADAEGRPSSKQTVGLHFPRRVVVESITYIGKEANELEDVDAGLVHSPDETYTVFEDARRDYWTTKVRPAMRRVSLATLHAATGLSRRTLINARTGQRRPHRKNRQIIIAALARLRLLGGQNASVGETRDR